MGGCQRPSSKAALDWAPMSGSPKLLLNDCPSRCMPQIPTHTRIAELWAAHRETMLAHESEKNIIDFSDNTTDKVEMVIPPPCVPCPYN